MNDHSTVQRLLSGVQWVIWVCGGPYFFKEEGVTVTVTLNHYCELLERFLHPKVIHLFIAHNLDDVCFQQDGATFHMSQHLLVILCDMFLVFLRGDIGWPQHFLDLAPCGFFF